MFLNEVALGKEYHITMVSEKDRERVFVLLFRMSYFVGSDKINFSPGQSFFGCTSERL
jgi:hypothetical protein